MLLRILAAAVVCAGGAGMAWACQCAGTAAFCENPPDPHEKNHAVFVGRVVEVYPGETGEEYAEALHGPAARSGARPTFESYRASLLNLWRGVLTEEEENALRLARTSSEIQKPLRDLDWTTPRRVHLEVAERFLGAESAGFHVFTGSGSHDCGVGFRKGEVWLVSAQRRSAGVAPEQTEAVIVLRPATHPRRFN